MRGVARHTTGGATERATAERRSRGTGGNFARSAPNQGAKEEHHGGTTRKVGECGRIVKTMETLKRLGERLTVNMCVVRSNCESVDEFPGLSYHRPMGRPVIIFRLFNPVGTRQTGQYGMVVPRLVEQALRNEPLTVYGDGQQARCFLDVADAVAAIVGLAECADANREVFTTGPTEERTILGLAQKLLASVHGSDDVEAGVRFVPYEEVFGADFEDMRRRVPDITKIRSTIDWEPRVGLDETIRRVVKSHRKTVKP